MNERHVTVRIDRLVLRDVALEERASLVNSLKEELAQVFGAAHRGEALKSSSSTPFIRLGKIPAESGAAGSRTLGRSVARAIGKQVRR